MTEQTELKAAGNQTTETGQAALEKRRRLLKLGVSATPIVLTLASRSALACHCKSPSAAGSLTFASHKPAGTGADGSLNCQTYGNWMAVSGDNLPGGVPKTTKLRDIPLFATAFAGVNTTINALGAGFQRDIVTAYLNLSNPTGGAKIQDECLTLDKLKAMASGTYTASGVAYSSAQIQTYLASNGLLGY